MIWKIWPPTPYGKFIGYDVISLQHNDFTLEFPCGAQAVVITDIFPLVNTSFIFFSSIGTVIEALKWKFKVFEDSLTRLSLVEREYYTFQKFHATNAPKSGYLKYAHFLYFTLYVKFNYLFCSTSKLMCSYQFILIVNLQTQQLMRVFLLKCKTMMAAMVIFQSRIFLASLHHRLKRKTYENN